MNPVIAVLVQAWPTHPETNTPTGDNAIPTSPSISIVTFHRGKTD